MIYRTPWANHKYSPCGQLAQAADTSQAEIKGGDTQGLSQESERQKERERECKKVNDWGSEKRGKREKKEKLPPAWHFSASLM